MNYREYVLPDYKNILKGFVREVGDNTHPGTDKDGGHKDD
jgi:hypothetical protein